MDGGKETQDKQQRGNNRHGVCVTRDAEVYIYKAVLAQWASGDNTMKTLGQTMR
jgi:hypothetical protein